MNQNFLLILLWASLIFLLDEKNYFLDTALLSILFFNIPCGFAFSIHRTYYHRYQLVWIVTEIFSLHKHHIINRQLYDCIMIIHLGNSPIHNTTYQLLSRSIKISRHLQARTIWKIVNFSFYFKVQSVLILIVKEKLRTVSGRIWHLDRATGTAQLANHCGVLLISPFRLYNSFFSFLCFISFRSPFSVVLIFSMALLLRFSSQTWSQLTNAKSWCNEARKTFAKCSVKVSGDDFVLCRMLNNW